MKFGETFGTLGETFWCFGQTYAKDKQVSLEKEKTSGKYRQYCQTDGNNLYSMGENAIKSGQIFSIKKIATNQYLKCLKFEVLRLKYKA